MFLIRPSYEILQCPDGKEVLKLLEIAGRTCYKSEDKITTESAPKFCKMILGRNHLSCIEHVNLTVKFIIDRGVSHELVRHRLCSFSQESTRYCNYNKKGITFIIPPWINIKEGKYKFDDPLGTSDKNSIIWAKSLWECEYYYYDLINNGWQPQQARSVLPNSLKTEIVMTANLREFMHILKLRTSSAAHPQMVEICRPLLHDLQQRIPVIFDDIKYA